MVVEIVEASFLTCLPPGCGHLLFQWILVLAMAARLEETQIGRNRIRIVWPASEGFPLRANTFCGSERQRCGWRAKMRDILVTRR
jgi:hypothetical protein